MTAPHKEHALATGGVSSIGRVPAPACARVTASA